MPESNIRFEEMSRVVDGLAIKARLFVPQESIVSLPIVLVHGLGVSGRYMIPVARLLAQRHRVFVPDLPGFGRSDKPAGALDVPALADLLSAWLKTVGISRAALLGNSIGCQVIVDLAVRYPQQVHSAILIGPTVDRKGHTLPRQLWRGFRDLWREPWSLWPVLALDYWATGTSRLYHTFRYALLDPVEEKLARVAAPTLIIRGGRDPIVPQRWAEEIAALLPHGRLVVIPRGTHATHYSAPAEVAHIVSEFLAKLNLTK